MSLAGVGKSHKPYYVNLRREIVFNHEHEGSAKDSATARYCEITMPQFATSGPIEEQPNFVPKNKRGNVKKHSQIGANHKVLKLGFEGEFGYKTSIENYKPLARIMGGIIDYPRRIEMSGDSNWDNDEEVTISSKVVGVVESTSGYSTPDIVLKEWTQGENMEINAGTGNGDTSFAKLLGIYGYELMFDPTSPLPGSTGITTPDNTTVYEGGTSGARVQVNQLLRIKATIANMSNSDGFAVGQTVAGATGEGVVVNMTGSEIEIYVTTDGFTDETITGQDMNSYTADISDIEVLSVKIEEISDGDTLAGDAGSSSGAGAGTVSDIIYGHYIFAHREVPSWSQIYHYESLSDQHLLTGSMPTTVTLEATSNDVPKIDESFNVSQHGFDDTVDAEQTNTTTDLYDFTDLSFTLDSDDYSEVYKTVSLEISREYGGIWGNSLNRKGMKGPEISFALKLGIHREDKVLHNKRINDTSFNGVFTLRRGASGEDECILYFDNSTGDAQLRALEFPESENEKTIFMDAPYDVEGTPVFQVYDKEPYYGM